MKLCAQLNVNIAERWYGTVSHVYITFLWSICCSCFKKISEVNCWVYYLWRCINCLFFSWVNPVSPTIEISESWKPESTVSTPRNKPMQWSSSKYERSSRRMNLTVLDLAKAMSALIWSAILPFGSSRYSITDNLTYRYRSFGCANSSCHLILF